MRKSVALALVVLFLVGYALFGGFAKGDPAFWTTQFPVLLVGTFVTLFCLFFWLNLRGRRDYLDGASLLNQGRLVEALEAVTRAAKRSPRMAAYEYLRAVCLLQLLRLEEAEQSFRAAQALTQSERVRALYSGSAQLVFALQGKPTLIGEDNSADRVFARGVELTRKGEWQAALEQLAHPSQQMLWGTTRVLKDVLTAWCQQALGHEKRAVDLAPLRQAGVVAVGTFWPELERQLEATPDP